MACTMKVYMLFIFSLHNATSRKLAKEKPLDAQGVSACSFFWIMQDFIHSNYTNGLGDALKRFLVVILHKMLYKDFYICNRFVCCQVNP